LEYEIEIPDEDVEMVANSAGVSEDEARQALEECQGDLAEAIMKLNQ
jgi:nascent polypeptide-associated complex subunit alpha